MKSGLVLLTLLSFVLGCSDNRYIPDQVTGRILSQLAKHMKKKGLIAIGSGGGCTIDKKINRISMTFQCNNILKLDQSRELMVEAVQTLLNLINDNPENDKYFEYFPASEKIMVITILSKQCPADPECVEAVSILKGTIYYDIDHPMPHIAPYLTLKEETFDEAKKIVSSQNRSDENSL